MTKEKIFNDNMNIAYKIANEYRINCINEYEDIKQVALLGLWKAVLKYNHKYKFSTFAYTVIRNEINQYLRNNKKNKSNISINTIIHENLTIEDTLEAEDEVEKIIDKLEIMEINKNLNEVIENEKLINKQVYKLLQKGYKQKQIAEKLNISQPQVSRIQKKIIEKVRIKIT